MRCLRTKLVSDKSMLLGISWKLTEFWIEICIYESGEGVPTVYGLSLEQTRMLGLPFVELLAQGPALVIADE